jgi:hypothetical protein
MAAAGKIEAQIDLGLQEGRQTVQRLFGKKAGNGEDDAEQQDDADADGLPAGEIEHSLKVR